MQFDSENIYHLYNRGNNSRLIFFERENYLFFLQKIRKHLSPFVEILAYCLMPNHFHFLIYTPSDSDSQGDFKSPCESDRNHEIIKAIAVILRSYTRAINKKHKWTGSLFQQATKAKLITNKNDYSFTCLHYIHQNPVKAKLVEKAEEWEFSSYKDYASIRNGTLCNRGIAYEILDIPINGVQFVIQSESVNTYNFDI